MNHNWNYTPERMGFCDNAECAGYIVWDTEKSCPVTGTRQAPIPGPILCEEETLSLRARAAALRHQAEALDIAAELADETQLTAQAILLHARALENLEAGIALPEALRAALRRRITAALRRFRGDCVAWVEAAMREGRAAE